MLERAIRHWPLKLLALVLAFVVWLSVTGDTSIVQDFNAPLDLRLPPERALSSDPPTAVVVRLRGPETAVRRIDPLRLVVRVALSEDPVGPREVPISAADVIGVPRDVKVDFVSPERVAVVLDRRVERRLAVEPTFMGEPPEGYVYYDSGAEPAELVVVGPASEIEAVERLPTAPIPLDRLTAPATFPAVAVPAPPHARILDPRPVEVRVLVFEAPIERSFGGVRVELRGAGPTEAPVPGSVSITLSGPPAFVAALDAAQVRAVADIDGLAARVTPYRVRLRVEVESSEPGLELFKIRSVRPREVEVRVRERNAGR